MTMTPEHADNRAAETMHPVSIRWATPADAPSITRLSDELRAVLGDPKGALTPEAVLRDGFCETPEFSVLVAVSLDAVVGYALFYNVYEPAYAARGVYLADLFVAEGFRRHGVGRALMDAVGAEAAARGRTYVWWLSQPTNSSAAAFYTAFGPDITAPTVARVRLVRRDP